MQEIAKTQAINQLLIAEATEYEFKSELEVKHPKSWLRTVSAEWASVYRAVGVAWRICSSK